MANRVFTLELHTVSSSVVVVFFSAREDGVAGVRTNRAVGPARTAIDSLSRCWRTVLMTRMGASTGVAENSQSQGRCFCPLERLTRQRNVSALGPEDELSSPVARCRCLRSGCWNWDRGGWWAGGLVGTGCFLGRMEFGFRPVPAADAMVNARWKCPMQGCWSVGCGLRWVVMTAVAGLGMLDAL